MHPLMNNQMRGMPKLLTAIVANIRFLVRMLLTVQPQGTTVGKTLIALRTRVRFVPRVRVTVLLQQLEVVEPLAAGFTVVGELASVLASMVLQRLKGLEAHAAFGALKAFRAFVQTLVHSLGMLGREGFCTLATRIAFWHSHVNLVQVVVHRTPPLEGFITFRTRKCFTAESNRLDPSLLYTSIARRSRCSCVLLRRANSKAFATFITEDGFRFYCFVLFVERRMVVEVDPLLTLQGLG